MVLVNNLVGYMFAFHSQLKLYIQMVFGCAEAAICIESYNTQILTAVVINDSG